MEQRKVIRLSRQCGSKYLLIPVAAGRPLEELSIYADGKKVYDFKIPVSESTGCYEFQYYAPIPLSEYAGSVIEIEGNTGQAFLEALAFSDTVPKKADSHPAIHFSANTGWINDPNGFFYSGGIYHLFFQHNPFDIRWENMSWGHAVSTDLLHWQQRDTVLYPDEDGTIFSGCAIVNERGLIDLPADSPVFFYTSAGNQSAWSRGKEFVQKIAYSPDAGESIRKTGITAVHHIAGANRDPKVYWHEESKGYYMVLYLEGNEFAILRSGDLVNWKISQRISLECAWECPDLVRVPVEGGGSRWIFWSADGFYYLGDFDGYTFTQTGPKMEAYASALPYAAQTCWGEERILSVPWLRTGNEGRTYTGTMGLPRELTLAKYGGRLKLRQRPVRELSQCMEEVKESGRKEDTVFYRVNSESAAELSVTLRKGRGFAAAVGKIKVRYHSENRRLTVDGCVMQTDEEKWRKAEENRSGSGGMVKEIRLEKEPDTVSVLADHEIMEITIDEGMVCAAFEIPFDRDEAYLEVSVEGGTGSRLCRIF